MIGRVYAIEVPALSVSAASDLLEIVAGTGKPFDILSAIITQETSESSEQLALALYRLSASGTGGTAVTPRPTDANNAQAFGGTATKARTASGARSPAESLWREGQNVLNGWRYVPTPEERIDVTSAGIVAIALINAPAVVTPIIVSIIVNVMEY